MQMQQHEVDAFVKAFMVNGGVNYEAEQIRDFLFCYLSGWPDSGCVSKFGIRIYTAVLDSLNVWNAAKEYYSERQNG